MADSKRQSVGSRVATPKPVAQGPGELDTALGKAIGARVKLTTASPSSTLEGTIFTACPITNLVAINTAPLSSSTGDYHIIPVSRIQSFSIISLPEASSTTNASSGEGPFTNAQPAISAIDVRSLKAREEAAIRKMKERDATRGKGVTREAQDIFDALARTLPTRWHETSIIVNDTVRINAPYRSDDCVAPKDQQNALARVRKVLENERRKIAERNNAKVATPLPPSVGASGPPRKGG